MEQSMLLNRKGVLCLLIFQTIISISYGIPTNDTEKEYHEEIYESEIENIIVKKEEVKPKNEKSNETSKQEINNTTNEENMAQKIDQLEKEKSDLYKQINKAIDDSVVLLEHTNDTEAKLGINFMNDLKDQLRHINGSDINVDHKEISIQRRRANNSINAEKKILITYQEISDLFKERRTNETKKLEHANDIELQQKIDDWILQRQLEKKKILEYKGKFDRDKREKCPRQGLNKKKIKVNGKKRRRFNPCCRKCCKRSYLGCL